MFSEKENAEMDSHAYEIADRSLSKALSVEDQKGREKSVEMLRRQAVMYIGNLLFNKIMQDLDVKKKGNPLDEFNSKVELLIDSQSHDILNFIIHLKTEYLKGNMNYVNTGGI